MAEANKVKFDRQILLDILYDDVGGKVIRDVICETSRWSEHHDLIFSKDGKLWSTNYSRGLTEQQDESPWEYEDDGILCVEVEAYNRVVVDYRAVNVEKTG